ncbi:tripartite tricarboxylate transporter permease [Oricola sp.]|uniref:tripartite tricarboxylate transporter permease n=1 Tax=Oricola sp. TaxID=1979950 RepID=UPI0025FC3F72|nr:tripartite tricarboxylate transporter permease [Oricola sp.]MCI5075247.1 tripartite tricarboxylate transporter permease [Oricola sp.]
MIEGMLHAFATVSMPSHLLLILLGTVLGLMVGALPGLSSPMAIIVLLPITYSLEPLSAFELMMGIYVSTKLGGSFASILLRTPGTPAAACTVLDGYPMAQQGKASLALGYSAMASTAGGLISWIVAIAFVPIISAVALHSEPADIALLAVAGLTLVASFTRASMVRGMMGVLIGLLISSVGYDVQEGIERYSFGHPMLASGVSFSAVLVGFFGMAVVLSDLDMVGKGSTLVSDKIGMQLPSLGDMLRRWRAWTIGTVYGVVVGAIPGVGSDGSVWMAYATVRGQSKNPENFGKGEPDGILAPESSNNATTGGTMIPMLTLGIPGDGSTAVMLGAMILHGLQPGVTLMQTSGDFVYGILASLFYANIFMLVVALASIRLFIAILRRDRASIFPFILVFTVIGAFAEDNQIFPVYVAIACGVAGYILEARKFPVVTIVLGTILGPIIEYNVRLGLAYSAGDWSTFVGTWPRAIMVAAIAFLVCREVYLVFTSIRAKASTQQTKRETA